MTKIRTIAAVAATTKWYNGKQIEKNMSHEDTLFSGCSFKQLKIT